MALSSGNWTVAFLNGDRLTDTVVASRKKYVHLKLTMASGQWPSAGVQMPSAGSAGLVRNLDTYILNATPSPTASTNYTWHLTTGLKLRVFKARLTTVTGAVAAVQPATGTLAAKIFQVTAVGW
jgi:hypothetical protein